MFFCFSEEPAAVRLSLDFRRQVFDAKRFSVSTALQRYGGFERSKISSFILSEEVGAIDFALTTEILKKEFDMIKEDVLDSFKKKKDTKIINLFLEDKSFDEIQSITGDNLRHIYYVIKKFQKLFGQEIKKRNYQ